MFYLMWEKSRNLTPVISRFSKGINTKILDLWANDASQGRLALSKRSFLLRPALPSVNILAKFLKIGNELDVRYLGHSGISKRGISRKAFPPNRKSKPPRYDPARNPMDNHQAPASGKKTPWDLNKWTQEGVKMSKRVVPYFKGALRKQAMKRKLLKEAQAEETKRKMKIESELLEQEKRQLFEAALMEERKRKKLESALSVEKREHLTEEEKGRNVKELRSEVSYKKEFINQNPTRSSNEQVKTNSLSRIKVGSGEGDGGTKTASSSGNVKKSATEASPPQGRKRAKTLLDVLSERRTENKFPKPRRIMTDVRIRSLVPVLPISQEGVTEFFGKRGMVDAATLDKLETGFKKLECSDSKSLLKKYLTRDVFEKLKNQKTPTFGSTLLDCIQSGLENHDSGVGIYAPDAESYSVFADLFDPIIQDYHGGFQKCDKHPAKDWGDVDTFANLDPAGEFIISTRVRCGRSLQGYPFNPCLTEAQYKEMEEKMSCTLSSMSGELKGTYYPLTGMSKPTQQQLIDDHFLFKEGDRFLQAANACRFWPSGRGIYHNDDKTFLVWVNEEDHLRLISMQMGGDLGQVYRRLVSAVNEIEKKVPFSHDDRLGFLTFCPTNLGTTVRASVHIKVPKLASNKQKLEEVAGKYNLQVRGTRGEHTEAEGGVYDISNKRRMGLTEFQAVKEMNDGIAEIIKIEREL